MEFGVPRISEESNFVRSQTRIYGDGLQRLIVNYESLSSEVKTTGFSLPHLGSDDLGEFFRFGEGPLGCRFCIKTHNEFQHFCSQMNRDPGVTSTASSPAMCSAAIFDFYL